MRYLTLVAALLFGSPVLAGEETAVFAPPQRLEADGKPIDTDVGHAHPLAVDWDGDGDQDLLVGQFGSGFLWIFENEGTATQPRYAAGVKFTAAGENGRVPTG